MAWSKLRPSEWALVAYFAYVALLVPFFPERAHLSYQPLVVLAVVFLLLSALAQWESFAPQAVSIARDWIPLALTLAAFREMELFIASTYDHRFEIAWMRWDDWLLRQWGLTRAIESLGPVLPFYLELCYLLVYGVGAYCLVLIWLRAGRSHIDRFLVIYLVGTLLAYGLFPFFPSQPPRIAFPGVDAPHVSSFLRTTNLFILNGATIHVGVFPSAHVSSAFSAAWALFLILPKQKRIAWGLLGYAISVSLATVYGRYHYAPDVLAGFGFSLVAALLCVVFYLRDRAEADWEPAAGRGSEIAYLSLPVLGRLRSRLRNKVGRH